MCVFFFCSWYFNRAAASRGKDPFLGLARVVAGERGGTRATSTPGEAFFGLAGTAPVSHKERTKSAQRAHKEPCTNSPCTKSPCTKSPAQRTLHRETCAGSLAQGALHREPCTLSCSMRAELEASIMCAVLTCKGQSDRQGRRPSAAKRTSSRTLLSNWQVCLGCATADPLGQVGILPAPSCALSAYKAYSNLQQ